MLENGRKIEDSLVIYQLNSVKLRTNLEKKIVVITSAKLKQMYKIEKQSIYQQLH